MCNCFRFKELRENYYDNETGKELTQGQLADIFHVNWQVIGRLERNPKNIDPGMLKAYSEFFNVSVEYLLGLSDVKSVDLDTKAVCKKTGLREDAVNTLISQNRLHEIIDQLCKAQGIPENSFFTGSPAIATEKKDSRLMVTGDTKKLLSPNDLELLESWINTPDDDKRKLNTDTLSDLIVYASESIQVLFDFFNGGKTPFDIPKCDRITLIGEQNGTIIAVKDMKRSGNKIMTNPVDNRYI